MTTGSSSGEGLRRPTAPGKEHSTSHHSDIAEWESGLFDPSHSHPEWESDPSKARGLREANPNNVRDSRRSFIPEGDELLKLRPATWSSNDESSTSGNTLPEADEHGQAFLGVKNTSKFSGRYDTSDYVFGTRHNNTPVDFGLSNEQIEVIKQAEARLTPQQRDQFSRRVSIQTPSKEPSASSGKGKSTDPRNWGALNLLDDEIDIELQQQVLDSLNRLRDAEQVTQFLEWQKAEEKKFNAIKAAKEQERLDITVQPIVKIEEVSSDSLLKSTPRAKSEVLSETMADRIVNLTSSFKSRRSTSGAPDQNQADRPSNFIAQDSRLARTLFGSQSPPNATPSNSSAPSSQGRNPLYKINVKPIPPTEYSGAVNTRDFMRFVKQVSNYVEDGNIPVRREVDMMSNYLKGGAYNFYERTCGDNPEDWTLQQFFIKLYDHVFPLSFRTEQRRKLRRCSQGKYKVRDYVGYFKDLCDTIGPMNEHEKVSLLWDGFTSEIAAGLYNRNLHPERSTFDEVIENAEVIELIEEVKQKHGQNRAGPSDYNNRGSHGNGGRAGSSSNSSTQNKSSGGRNGNNTASSSQQNKSGQNSSNQDSRQKTKTYRNKLSKEDQNRYRAENRCFNCSEVGHTARQCPKNQNVKSDKKSSGPPGYSTHNMEFELSEVDALHDAIQDPVIELSLNCIDWFEDVEATYYSDESEDWQTEEGEELTESEFVEEDSDLDPMPALQDVSDNDTEYGYESDSSSLDEGSTTYLKDSQFLTRPKSMYPNHFDKSKFSVTASAQTPDYPTYFDSTPFSLKSETRVDNVPIEEMPGFDDEDNDLTYELKEEIDPFEWMAYKIEQDQQSAVFRKHLENCDWDYIDNVRNGTYREYPFRLPRPTQITDLTARRQVYIHRQFNHTLYGWKNDPVQREFGDPLANHAQYLLATAAPYAGDDALVDPTECDQYERFSVSRISEMEHLVTDHGYTYLGNDQSEFPIPSAWLETPEFNIVQWYSLMRSRLNGYEVPDQYDPEQKWMAHPAMEDVYGLAISSLLGACSYFPGDEIEPKMKTEGLRFSALPSRMPEFYVVKDLLRGFIFMLPVKYLQVPKFDLYRWMCKQYVQVYNEAFPPTHWLSDEPIFGNLFVVQITTPSVRELTDDEMVDYLIWRGDVPNNNWIFNLELGGVQVPSNQYAGLQRNAAMVKDPGRKVPRPVVVEVIVNNQPAKALIDSGSLGDFISNTLIDQLKCEKRELTTPLTLQLAVQGSRSKVNWETVVDFEYQNIKEKRRFDATNLSNYDLILGTPFLFQHQVTLGFNPTRVVIESSKCLPLQGPTISQLASRSMEIYAEHLEQVRNMLKEYAKPICGSAENTDLPPLRVINHRIPLIDESLVIPWRPSRLPEKFRDQWAEKRNTYIRTGAQKDKLRVVVDLRRRNANTRKLASPLPDIDGILRRAARARYRSMLDGKDAYEQIRIEPDDVWKTAVSTPDGNMILWSCISVLIACTWASVHPNVPSVDDASRYFKVLRRKIGLMLMALIAPEMLVLWAARQWFAARRLSAGYKGWTRTHALFALMGGFALYDREEFVSVLRFIPPESGQRQIILNDLNHIPAPQPQPPPKLRRWHPSPNFMNFDERSFAAHVRLIARMKTEEIKDRSHSDWFGKLIAVGQTTWFIVQLIARWVQDLPVTALEIMTLGFAALNILVYFFWWDKPLEIGYHVRIQRAVSRQVGRGKRRVEPADDDDLSQCRSTKWISAPWKKLQGSISEAMASFRKRIQNWWTTKVWKERSAFGVVLNILLFIYYVSFGTFNALMNSFIIKEEDEYLLEFPPERVRSFERIPGLEPTHAKDRCIAYGAGVMFGAIHCVAWNTKFPNTTEKLLWRYSSVSVIAIPIYLALVNVMNSSLPSKSRSGWWFLFFRLVYAGAGPLYILARLSLIVQAFVALRDLPFGAYENVQWTLFIPHIY